MLCLDARFGWWDDRETALVEARAYADKALEIDPNNARCLRHVWHPVLMQRRYDEAVADATEEQSNSHLARRT